VQADDATVQERFMMFQHGVLCRKGNRYRKSVDSGEDRSVKRKPNTEDAAAKPKVAKVNRGGSGPSYKSTDCPRAPTRSVAMPAPVLEQDMWEVEMTKDVPGKRSKISVSWVPTVFENASVQDVVDFCERNGHEATSIKNIDTSVHVTWKSSIIDRSDMIDTE
jgi:hypothetical protein